MQRGSGPAGSPTRRSHANSNLVRSKQPRLEHCFFCDISIQFNGKFEFQRHLKGVHFVEPSVGDKSFYICAATSCKLTGRGTIYSRRSKAVAHAERDHPRVNLEALIRRSTVSAVVARKFARANSRIAVAPEETCHRIDIQKGCLDVHSTPSCDQDCQWKQEWTPLARRVERENFHHAVGILHNSASHRRHGGPNLDGESIDKGVLLPQSQTSDPVVEASDDLAQQCPRGRLVARTTLRPRSVRAGSAHVKQPSAIPGPRSMSLPHDFVSNHRYRSRGAPQDEHGGQPFPQGSSGGPSQWHRPSNRTRSPDSGLYPGQGQELFTVQHPRPTSLQDHEQFQCVFGNSVDPERNCPSDCKTLKDFLSQLVRHHGRRKCPHRNGQCPYPERCHNFHYCTRCFVRCPTKALLEAHQKKPCQFKCVTEFCTNYGRHLLSPCDYIENGHTENSHRAQWFELWRMIHGRRANPPRSTGGDANLSLIVPSPGNAPAGEVGLGPSPTPQGLGHTVTPSANPFEDGSFTFRNNQTPTHQSAMTTGSHYNTLADSLLQREQGLQILLSRLRVRAQSAEVGLPQHLRDVYFEIMEPTLPSLADSVRYLETLIEGFRRYIETPSDRRPLQDLQLLDASAAGALSAPMDRGTGPIPSFSTMPAPLDVSDWRLAPGYCLMPAADPDDIGLSNRHETLLLVPPDPAMLDLVSDEFSWDAGDSQMAAIDSNVAGPSNWQDYFPSPTQAPNAAMQQLATDTTWPTSHPLTSIIFEERRNASPQTRPRPDIIPVEFYRVASDAHTLRREFGGSHPPNTASFASMTTHENDGAPEGDSVFRDYGPMPFPDPASGTTLASRDAAIDEDSIMRLGRDHEDDDVASHPSDVDLDDWL